MRNNLSIATLTAFCFCCLFTAVAWAKGAPATVTIGAAAKKQSPVVFSHEKHIARSKSCDVCHHTNKGLTAATEAKAKIEKCSACHLDPKDAKVPSMREMNMQKNPFHVACVKCHKEGVAGKKGPVVCTGCHPKK